MGLLVPVFDFLVASALGFKDRVDPSLVLHTSSLAYNGFPDLPPL